MPSATQRPWQALHAVLPGRIRWLGGMPEKRARRAHLFLHA